MQNHQHINGDSGSDEYYTPDEIVEAARRVMGAIDLDPASSHIANQRIRASKFFTAFDDGLKNKRHGFVWMNHPFGRQTNRPWIQKLVAEWQSAGRGLYNLRLNFRTMVSAAARAPAVLSSRSH